MHHVTGQIYKEGVRLVVIMPDQAAGSVITVHRAGMIDVRIQRMKPVTIHSSAGIFSVLLFAVILACASAKNAPDENSPGKDCVHCHGEKLAGVKNVKLQCGSCHDLKPLDAGAIAGSAMKEIVTREPHVHKAKNMFSETPSCFMCHRQNDW